MSFAAAMLIALLIDVAVGWPDAVFRRVGHPVTWIGALISGLEVGLNRGSRTRRYVAGGALVLIVLLIVGAVAWGVARLVPDGWVGALVIGLLAWPLVAARSLYTHVAAVAAPLGSGDLTKARQAVAMIVGRNPETLDEPAIARAALESLAENASDAVVAPLFWGALLGLPGIAIYKAINTMDSMIGHRNERYDAFGYGAARLDDLVNLIPARLTGVLISAAAIGVRRTAFRTMLRDARQHRSPNAGWPEAAMAGGLGVRLSGPRVYDGVATEDPWLNPVAGDPRATDIEHGLVFFQRAMALFAFLLFVAVVT
ncbi:MAG: adenosylcobinamide-phosphate synthase CbiB [Pseudomonadota bacterium]